MQRVVVALLVIVVVVARGGGGGSVLIGGVAGGVADVASCRWLLVYTGDRVRTSQPSQVDTTDHERFLEAREELNRLLTDDALGIIGHLLPCFAIVFWPFCSA
jgi:hypothetical protein